jgi:ABC-type glucose/galactose transport system permease subunit
MTTTSIILIILFIYGKIGMVNGIRAVLKIQKYKPKLINYVTVYIINTLFFPITIIKEFITRNDKCEINKND